MLNLGNHEIRVLDGFARYAHPNSPSSDWLFFKGLVVQVCTGELRLLFKMALGGLKHVFPLLLPKQGVLKYKG